MKLKNLFSHPVLFIVALFTGGKLVALRHHDGEVNISIARTDAFGQLWARPRPLLGVGHTILFPNGTCGGDSRYITEWKYI